MLSEKSVLIGITGGIAAYKICELIRMFKRANASVRVICTPNALNFVTVTTLQNLSQNSVGVDNFHIEDFKPEHISYADEADIMVIAPVTANTISKIATGICDNLLTSTVCAFKKPVVLAPAMNTGMWENPVIQENIETLKNKLHYEIIEPENGFLACGTEGKGRLADIQVIFDKIAEILLKKNSNRSGKIVITAGGTIEDIDPVRYISNYSSGKMGLALADCAYNSGMDVVLITTKDVKRDYKVVKVKSAIEMEDAVNEEFETANYIIMAAAVADYRVKNKAERKIKKSDDSDEITIELMKNPDILKNLCTRKNNGEWHPKIIGFCAESENLINNAKEKIAKKGCDYLIANDISRKDIGFNSDYNEVIILDKNGGQTKLEKADKSRIAEQILDIIVK